MSSANIGRKSEQHWRHWPLRHQEFDLTSGDSLQVMDAERDGKCFGHDEATFIRISLNSSIRREITVMLSGPQAEDSLDANRAGRISSVVMGPVTSGGSKIR